jgi:DNA adenine methylase
MPITALAPWFGSNRLLAHRVGELLEGCNWVGIPFAGGMSELAYITARTIVVNDLHRHVINLATIAAHPMLGPKLYRRLKRIPFHPLSLAEAQAHCREFEPGAQADFAAAAAYFVASWMGRNGKAGTDDEFSGGLALRWNAGGGDSAVRYRSAVHALVSWRRVFARCTFSALDAFAFLEKCKDAHGHGIYCDPPFPGPGDAYRHKFDERQHGLLAERLQGFTRARVVCRFYDHPLVRELYVQECWEWIELVGRKQTNEDAPEVLLVNRAG